MTPSRDRPILGILSVISLIVLSYLLWAIPFKYEPSPAFYLVVVSVISAFNISILFGWLSMGKTVGIILAVISMLEVVFFDLRLGIEGYSMFVLPFFIASLIGYRLERIKNKLNQLLILRSEKLEEEMNVLSNSIKEKEASIASFEEKLRKYSKLEYVVESFSTVLSTDKISRLMIEESLKTIGKEGRALIFLVDTEKQELMLEASKNASGVKMKKGDVFDNWVLRHRKSLMVEDVVRDFRFPTDDIEESKAVFRSLIATPLVAENKVTGIIRIDNPKEFAYTQDDLRLLDIIADLGAVALQNAMLYSRIQELAIKDSLTGLAVRRYFMDRFQEEIKRTARKKGALSFMILDIDHFKKYNDKYGHMAGDLVLKYLARTVKSLIQEGDIAVRYGGEEIAILLCGRDKKSALKEAEIIRKTIEEKPFTLRRHVAKITVSIGISSYPEDAILEEDLIKIADGRLYKAKNAGRNKVC